MPNREHYKSDEEYAFALWCAEAELKGFIRAFAYEPYSYPLAEKKTLPPKPDTLKTASGKPRKQPKPKHLLHPHEYTPDFILIGMPQLDQFKHGLVAYDHSHNFIIDVKGTFQMHDGSRSFSINQKWVLDKYEIFVNKVIPQKFFQKTWVPQDVAFGKTGKRLKAYSKCPLLTEL